MTALSVIMGTIANMIFNDDDTTVVYKMFRKKNGELFPLFVNANEAIPMGIWLTAKVGQKADDTHVKSKIGKLSLRPGFHSCLIPFTDWIGKRGEDGNLYQRPDTVWCRCRVRGIPQEVTAKNGLRTLPETWYFFKTNAKQIIPWIISREILVECELSHEEVEQICAEYGMKAQGVA